jgi:hypothetical protein
MIEHPNAYLMERGEQRLTTEMLRQITESGFLTYRELGRLLLLMSKSFVTDLTKKYVWTALCNLHFKSPMGDMFPTSMITARGDKWIFQHACSRKVPSRATDSEGVEPEEQAGNKLLFLLSFRDSKNGTELFTTIVQGSDYLTTFTYDDDDGLEADGGGQEDEDAIQEAEDQSMHREEEYADPVIRLPEKFRKWLKDTITRNHLDGTYCTMHAFRTDTNQSCNLVWGTT